MHDARSIPADRIKRAMRQFLRIQSRMQLINGPIQRRARAADVRLYFVRRTRTILAVGTFTITTWL